MMTGYPIVEKFLSINGEGLRAGELAVFIRFKSCNLRCSYCDTKWAYENDAECEYLTDDDICSFAQGITNITLTGGEPMLNDIVSLCKRLTSCGHRVEIETNGSIMIAPLCGIDGVTFTMDYKLPSSGVEGSMCLENFGHLRACDTVKFVAGTDEDLIRAHEIINRYDLTNVCNVYFSPVFGKITALRIVEFMKEKRLNDVRVQLQLHKYIWNPEERGV